MRSRDRSVRLDVEAHPDHRIDGELFASIDQAAAFFRQGCLGWSPSPGRDDLHAVRLDSQEWDARAVAVDHITSSLFDNPAVFPTGAATLDSALLMENLPVSWITQAALDKSQRAPAA